MECVEDVAQDFCRPISMCRMSAGLDANGTLTALQIRVSGQSIDAFVSPQSLVAGNDGRQLQGFWVEPGEAQMGYTVPTWSASTRRCCAPRVPIRWPSAAS